MSQFAQHLLKLDPKASPSRTTLYNYLKQLVDPSTPFTPDVIHDFYSRVLQFEHWQNNSQSLCNVVRADVLSFLKTLGEERDDESWSKVRHSDCLQLVPIRLIQDMSDLIAREHEHRQKSGDRLKIVPLSEIEALLIVLSPSGSLEVKVYPALGMVVGSHLRLPAPVSHLFYGSDLELMPHTKQVLDGSLLTTHCFMVDEAGVHGLITRGHTFQKFETYIRAKLAETQDLFTSLKRIEHHFIDPQTDPFYQKLVARLDQANRLLSNPTPMNLDTAERALNKGRLYLKNAFPNDRLLTLLVTHLDYGISQRRDEVIPDERGSFK